MDVIAAYGTSAGSMAAIAAGADALMVEVHPNPAQAMSDGPQSLNPENYIQLMSRISKLAEFMKSI